jgi:hypothetical protein
MALGGADATLRYRITADDDSSVVFKKVGDNLTKVDKRFSDTTKGARILGNQFEDTKKRLSSLNDQFAKTGDVKLLKEINKAERDLSRLSAWQKRFKGDTDDSSKSLNVFSRTAQDAGERLRKAFPTSSAFANPMVLGVASAGAALVAIPAIAAVSGAAVAGVGLGFLGLGAMAVKGSKQVQSAATDLQGSWGRAMVAAGRDTEQHYVKALNILQDSASHVGPMLKRVLDDVTPSTVNLARGFDGLLRNAGPGLEKLGKSSGRVMNDLADTLPRLGTAVGNFGDSLSDAAEGGGEAAIDMVNVLTKGVERLGEVMEGASRTWHAGMEEDDWRKWLPPIAIARQANEIMTGVDESQKKVSASGPRAGEPEPGRLDAERSERGAISGGVGDRRDRRARTDERRVEGRREVPRHQHRRGTGEQAEHPGRRLRGDPVRRGGDETHGQR